MKKTLPKLSVLTTIAVVFGSVLVSCSGNKEGTDSFITASSVSSSSSSSVVSRTYNVTFVSDSKTCDIRTVKEGESISDMESPEKKGYSFDGWYMDEGTWEIPFDKGTVIRQDIKVYAKWSLVSYSITYKGPNDEQLNVAGTELPTSYTIEDDNPPLVSYAPKGYRFKCWEKEGLVMNYIPTGSVGDLVLQGRFDDTFTISYIDSKFGKKNDSNPEIFNVTMNPIELLPLEDATDYSFAGWVDESGEKVTSIDTTIGDDITLYATWEKKLEFEDFDYIADEESGRIVLLDVKDKTVTRLEIPDVFTGIKPGVLAGFDKLEELSVPYLGFDAETTQSANLAYLFGYESNETAGGAIPSSLTKVTVKRGVIGGYAFANLSNVEEIVLTPDITEIGFYAFYKCTKLTELTMPALKPFDYDTLEDRLKTNGISYNSGKQSMALYYGIANSGSGIYYLKDDSAPLINLHINGGENGGENYSQKMFAYCNGIGTLTVDNVNIHRLMFFECRNLTKVTMGNTVEEIECEAFKFCIKLTEVVIPDSVTKFGIWYYQYDGNRYYAYDLPGGVFGACYALTKVVIGNGVTTIPKDAFRECPLEELTIGENVRFVDWDAFLNLSTNLAEGKTLTIINKSKYKEWVVSGRVDATFMDSLMASDNAPEKIYYGYKSFEKDYSFRVNDTLTLSTTYQYFLSDVSGVLFEQYGTAEQIKRWKLIFYSPTDPYAEGGAASIDSADIEYWYHEDGVYWYMNQCFVTPKTWEKPQA